MTFVKSFFLIAGSTIIANSSFSQGKELTEKQMLRGEKTNITTSLPQVLGWTDDAHFLISSKVNPDSPYKVFLVDCKTGKQTPSSADILKKEPLASITVSVRNNDLFLNETGKPSKQLTNSKDVEINPTLSPDKKLVGFTRNNDLYTINLETGKENRITTDGTDLILNGYASWVYFEEILGRGSRYKSFWWSPDSKNICFMRMDDTKVPLFPIYNESGQHGFTENTRYPKSGDNNPTVRIGITPAEGGNIVWADFNENQDKYFGLPYWTPDAKNVLIQWMNRGQDNLKIYAVDLQNGSKK
jgi:dipeptidyl-peptidase-4